MALGHLKTIHKKFLNDFCKIYFNNTIYDEFRLNIHGKRQ